MRNKSKKKKNIRVQYNPEHLHKSSATEPLKCTCVLDGSIHVKILATKYIRSQWTTN